MNTIRNLMQEKHQMPQFKGIPLPWSISSMSYSNTIGDQLRTGTIFIITGEMVDVGGLAFKAQSVHLDNKVYFRVTNDERRRMLKCYESLNFHKLKK
jgi:hypothetical protein